MNSVWSGQRFGAIVVIVACVGGAVACDRGSQPMPTGVDSRDARADRTTPGPAAATAPDVLVAPSAPVDPGAFARNGCAVDASPPHMVSGTATVTFRAFGSLGLSYRNVPARCGAAFPGQLVDGVRTRPGEGAEFVVCMPEDRRLDVGILRRERVAPGDQDLAHLANPIRLRLGLDRYVYVASPGDTLSGSARLTFGPRLRRATGRAALGASPSGPAAGIVEFEIDCNSAR